MKLGMVMDKEERNLFKRSGSRSRSTVNVKNYKVLKTENGSLDCYETWHSDE
jgi:hypothetical protein